MSKILVIEHWFYHVQTHDEPNVGITFKVIGHGHSVNELKPFSYKHFCRYELITIVTYYVETALSCIVY